MIMASLGDDASEAEREAIEIAATEVIADYPGGWGLHVDTRAQVKEVGQLRWRVFERLA
jgi:hypothetical protein